MSRNNVYTVYSLRSKFTLIPFYIGITKANDNDLTSIQIKIGKEITKTELLRRILDNIDAEIAGHGRHISEEELEQQQVTRELNRQKKAIKGIPLGPARKRKFKTKVSILIADVIAVNLIKSKAQEIANKCTSAVKICTGGCPYESLLFMSVDEARQILSTYMKPIATFEESLNHPYIEFESRVNSHFRQTQLARERTIRSRARLTNSEIIINKHDPFGAFEDINNDQEN